MKSTLLELLRQRVHRNPEDPAFLGLEDEGAEPRLVTWRELDRRARALAAHLASMAVPGDRALLLLPDPLDFASAFYGCQLAGVIAVPANAPATPRLGRGLARMQAILTDATPRVAIASC